MRHLVEISVTAIIVVLSSESVTARNLIQLVPTSCNGGTAWKYKESSRRSTNWTGLTFNDKEWKTGSSGFGNMNKGGLTKTIWSGGRNDLYLRKEFKFEFRAKDIEKVELQYAIDDSIEVWLNGQCVRMFQKVRKGLLA